jgi:hypothetical protein
MNHTLRSNETLYGIFTEGSRGRPQWRYPEVRDSSTNENLSNISFDLLVCVGISLSTLVSLGIKFAYGDNSFFANLKERLDTAIRDTNREVTTRGPFREVSHIRKDSFFIWFSVMTAVAFITFKILTGSKEADAGQIFLVLLVAFFAKMLRQETSLSGTFKVLFSILPTGFALIASYFGYVGYAKNEAIYQKDEVNGWYVSSLVFAMLSVLLETFYTIFDQNLSNNKEKDEKSVLKMTGDYMYPIRLMDVIVVSLVTMFFFCFEGIAIARADAKFYAIPFWALWILPVYSIISQIVQATMYKSSIVSLVFNIVLTMHLLAIIMLGQMQVCSIFSVDSELPFTQLTADTPLKRSPIGCPGNWGLYQHKDTNEVFMRKGSVWVLAIVTSLFITALYSGASFTLYQMNYRLGGSWNRV